MGTKLKSWAFLVLAVGFAGATVILASRINQRPTTGERQQVIAAKGNLARGTVLTAANLELAAWPFPNCPLGAILKVEDAVGLVLVHPLDAGQPLLSSDVAKPGTTEAMQAQLPRGMRLLTVHPEEPRNPRDSLRPGSYVDIVAVYEKGPQTRRWESEIVLQRARVAGVGGADLNSKSGVGRADAGGVAVTLEIPAEEVETLARVAATSRLHLTLRPPDDDEWIPPAVKPVPQSPAVAGPPGPPAGVRRLELQFGSRQEVRWYVERVDEQGRKRWIEWKPEPAETAVAQVGNPAKAPSVVQAAPVP